MQELSGQLLIHLDDLDRARHELSVAQNEFRIQQTIWDFFISKWQAYIDLRLQPQSESAQNAFLALRARAENLGHWESVRDCDRTLAIAKRDEKLLLKVYFGTPFVAYRERLIADAKLWFQLPKTFVLGSDRDCVVDLSRGMTTDGTRKLKPGKLLHRGLLATTSDLYKPIHIGNLHAKLFPEDHFNPASSPDRVLNVVKRLREWFDDTGLPLSLQTRDRSYRLALSEGLGLLYTSESEAQPGDESQDMIVSLERLRKEIPTEPFDSLEAAKRLELSKSSVAKILTWGVHQQRLHKYGAGKNTRYSFAA